MAKTQQRTEKTKKKILQAAKKLFIKHGFAGTAMGKIAEQAQVPHSLLFHHFGNKEKLWVAVKQCVVNEAKQEKPIIPSTTLPWTEFVKEILKNNYQFYIDSEDIRRLIHWQRLEKETKGKMNIGLSEEALKWVAAIEHYQKENVISSELKPEFIVTMIASLTLHVVLDPNYFLLNDTQKEDYLAFCARCIIKATVIDANA